MQNKQPQQNAEEIPLQGRNFKYIWCVKVYMYILGAAPHEGLLTLYRELPLTITATTLQKYYFSCKLMEITEGLLKVKWLIAPLSHGDLS